MPTPGTLEEQAAQSTAAEPDADQAHVEPEAPPTPTPDKRTWSMPKNPVTRERADEAGRIAIRAGVAVAAFVAGVARYSARVVRHVARGIEAVPPMLRTLILMGALMLLGIVGSIALHNTVGLLCTVVVVPLCSIALGALGYRWSSGLGNHSVDHVENSAGEATSSELQRSVQYVDKKLTAALTAFSADRHQAAMVALFQAKTAVEFTLGTERNAEDEVEALLSVEDHTPRPRIQAGSTPKSLLRDSSSLVAS